MHIVKADTGQVVYSHNAHKAMIPASNMKLITTAAAVKLLPAKFEYVTSVGLYDRSLAILGCGDPLLGDKVTDAKYGREAGWILDDIVTVLKKNGITRIRDIIVDSSVFDDNRVHPNWPEKELNRWYACEVSGLNYNGNCIELTAMVVKGVVKLSVEPQTDYVKIINKCKPTSKPPNTVWCSRPKGTNTVTVHGKCYKQCRPIRIAVERPAVFLGFVLVEKLVKAGITIEGQLIEKEITSIKPFEPLAKYETKLPDVLARCNKDSFNLAAEALSKTIASNSNNDYKNGSWQAARKIVSGYLHSLDIDDAEFYIDDASGLSRHNRLSPNAISTVLLDVYKSQMWQVYKDSLAVGGVDGTISKYFKDGKYKGKILGKTGYINNVRSFSRLAITHLGEYVFVILTNSANRLPRKVINDIVKTIIDVNASN